MRALNFLPILSLCLILGCSVAVSVPSSSTKALAAVPTTNPDDWQHQTAALKLPGVLHDEVYTVTVPRSDIWVQEDMGEIPIAAGIASRFDFFKCTCGKGKVVGQFVLVDDEVNNVIDALRHGPIEIASIAPMFLNDHPRIMVVRFQGEGDTPLLAETIRQGLDWTKQFRLAR